jgi:hypothetical protein
MAFSVYPVVWTPLPPTPGTPVAPYDPAAMPEEVKNAQDKPGTTPNEPDANAIAAHHAVAKNLLTQKNRKRRRCPRMELPFDPKMEEGLVYALQGFGANFDGNWCVSEVVFTFQGKSGSRMEIELTKPEPPPVLPAGPVTPATTAKLVKNDSVGGSNPLPESMTWNDPWLAKALQKPAAPAD